MVRSIFLLINYFLWTFLLGGLVILVSAFDIKGRMIGKIIRLWGWILMKASGIKYRIRGLENLVPSPNYFFAANHESALDIPAALAALPFQVVFVAKKELKKIPFLGWGMTRARYIFVDRSRHQAALKSLEKAAESLKKYPRSVLVFPEGTRSTDGQVHRFKRGALGVALQVGMPVVPLAICGTSDVLSRRSLRLRSGEVEIRLGVPIDTELWSGRSPNEFADYVREQVISLKNAWRSETGRLDVV